MSERQAAAGEERNAEINRLALNNISAADNFDIAAWINNAFDKSYAIAPNILVPGFPVQAIVPGEPRTCGVSLRYRL